MSAAQDGGAAGGDTSIVVATGKQQRYAPPADLAANANVTAEAYEQAKADRHGFWAEQARRLTWAEEPTETLDWSNPPFAKWF
ncbi:acetyl-coenzyme A synthetase N-terminal domain-containing protein, partial [Streptomyces sp. NPDC033538]|uniref:acetyl-coenzyme A synthetase N-terminal domain-containing protein n=1 Tax=Streptomyces sp. NPDC033538 TaxID=3155367 RepID=UPI0033D254C8